MNDNEVVIEEGITSDDALYLSLPTESASPSVKYLQTASGGAPTPQKVNNKCHNNQFFIYLYGLLSYAQASPCSILLLPLESFSY